MGRIACRLVERLAAELRGGRKVKVRARSNVVMLSALCRSHHHQSECVSYVLKMTRRRDRLIIMRPHYFLIIRYQGMIYGRSK